jgi:hypothetical protein
MALKNYNFGGTYVQIAMFSVMHLAQLDQSEDDPNVRS